MFPLLKIIRPALPSIEGSHVWSNLSLDYGIGSNFSRLRDRLVFFCLLCLREIHKQSFPDLRESSVPVAACRSSTSSKKFGLAIVSNLSDVLFAPEFWGPDIWF